MKILRLPQEYSRTHASITGLFMLLFLSAMTIIQLKLGGTPEPYNTLSLFQIFCSGLIIVLLGVSARQGFSGSRINRLSIYTLILLFSTLAVIHFFYLDDLFTRFEFQIDIGLTSLGLAGGILLWFHVTSKTKDRFAAIAILAGLSLNLLLSLQNVLDPFKVVFLPPENIPAVETIESSLKSMSLVLYVFALLLSISRTSQKTNIERKSFGNIVSKILFRAEYQTIGAFLSIAFNNAHWWLWHLFNNNKSFADFYSWKIIRKLDKGRAHRTLGKRRFDADDLFGSVPEHDFLSMQRRYPSLPLYHFMKLGLEPHHTLVDYGCGSLRLGYPLISFLEPSRYWGLDISERFYEDGLKLIGDELAGNKKPQFRVINQHSLNEVRKTQPDFIISTSVLKHVPEIELDDYFNKLCSMMQKKTTLAITFVESPVEKQILGKSWSWSEGRIHSLMQDRCPHHDISIVMRNSPLRRNGIFVSKCMIVATPGELEKTQIDTHE